MIVSLERAAQLVDEALSGESVHNLHVGDVWELRFSNDLWLLAHEVSCAGEERFNELLARAEPDVLSGVDPDDAVKSLLLVSYMRRPVTACRLDHDGRLILEFGERRTLSVPTDVDIVDWQWCLSPSAANPYAEPFVIACIAAGVLEVPED